MMSSKLHHVIHSYKYTSITISTQANDEHNCKQWQLLSDSPEHLYCIT